jgi:hypothetical protein
MWGGHNGGRYLAGRSVEHRARDVPHSTRETKVWFHGNWFLIWALLFFSALGSVRVDSRQRGVPPVPQRHDPDFHVAKSTNIAGLLHCHPVEVVVAIDQQVPSHSHPAWATPEVNAVIWITSQKMRKGSRFPTGWDVECRSVSHNSVGEASNGQFWGGIAMMLGFQSISGIDK